MTQAQTEDWQKMVLLSAAAREVFYDKKNREEILKKIAAEIQEMSKKHKLNVNMTTILPAKALNMLFSVNYNKNLLKILNLIFNIVILDPNFILLIANQKSASKK